MRPRNIFHLKFVQSFGLLDAGGVLARSFVSDFLSFDLLRWIEVGVFFVCSGLGLKG